VGVALVFMFFPVIHSILFSPASCAHWGVANLQIGARLLLGINSADLCGLGVQFATPRMSIQRSAKEEGNFMLGEQISETKGRRLVRRVLSVDPPTAEVSFEDSGQMLGVATTGMGTYTSIVSPDGTIHGEGQGMSMTVDGEAITWTGNGVGKFGPGGSVSYRGMLFFRTASQKLARLNGVCGAFEYEVDASGSTTSKVWEWK
jgi:hypothetical protein